MMMLKEYAGLKGNRSNVEAMWQEIEKYICPFRGDFYQNNESENSQDWNRYEIYDSTGIMSAKALASAIHDSLTNPNAKWFGVRFQFDFLNQDEEAREWLEIVSERIWQAIQESDFNLEIQETFYDLVTYGSSVIFEQNMDDENWDGIDFESVPMKDAFFIEDFKGQVRRFYRRYHWTDSQVVSLFGDDTPEEIRKKAEEGKDTQTRNEYVYCIYPVYENRNADVSKQLAVDARPWGSCYMRVSDGLCLKEGGFYENPAFIPRWAKTNESKHGNSPSFIAMPAIKTVNALRYFDLRSREKVLDPSILAEERALLSDFDLEPAGLTIVRNIAGIKPFESGANFGATNDAIERLQDDIKQMFYVDQLLLPPMGGTPATATEIQARLQQLWRLMGPAVGRIQVDLLDPIIQRTFNILQRAGELPDPPEVILENDAGMDIEYLGMLARSQKSEEADAIMAYLERTANLSQVFPDLVAIVDVEEAGRTVARNMGIPARVLKTTEEVSQERRKAQADAQEMQTAQKAQMEGDAAKAMGEGAEALGGMEQMQQAMEAAQ